jgi:hypothetical protein
VRQMHPSRSAVDGSARPLRTKGTNAARPTPQTASAGELRVQLFAFVLAPSSAVMTSKPSRR